MGSLARIARLSQPVAELRAGIDDGPAVQNKTREKLPRTAGNSVRPRVGLRKSR
jgi:hypothetical protein